LISLKDIVKKHAFVSHSGAVYALEKANSNYLFFSGSGDKYIALWNLETMQPENFAAQLPAIVYSLCYIHELDILLAGTASGSIHVIDLTQKKEVKILQNHTDAIFDIKYSFDKNIVYAVSADGNFSISSLDNFTFLQSKKLCSQKVRSIAICDSLSEVAIAAGDGCVYIYDLNTLEEKRKIQAHQLSVNKVCYSPDSKFLLSGGKDAHLNIFDASSYELVKTIPAHNFAIYDIVFSPDGKMFATASRDKTVKLWDAESFEIIVRLNKEKFDGHINSVNKLMWSNYHSYLVSTGDDRSILVWKVC
jgi:WD40 repeat protein